MYVHYGRHEFFLYAVLYVVMLIIFSVVWFFDNFCTPRQDYSVML